MRFEEGPFCLRRIVRVLPLLLLPPATVHAGAILKVSGLSWANGPWVGLLPGAGSILLLVGVALHLATVGERWGLTRLARATKWAALFFGVAVSVPGVIQPLATLLNWKVIAEGFLWDYGVLSMPAVLATVWYVSLLVQYKRRFTDARKLQRSMM